MEDLCHRSKLTCEGLRGVSSPRPIKRSAGYTPQPNHRLLLVNWPTDALLRTKSCHPDVLFEGW